VRQILAKSEMEVDQWRDALREQLGSNGQLIVNLIPELEFVIGEQPPVPELPPQDALKRFQMVFGRFIGAYSGKPGSSENARLYGRGTPKAHRFGRDP
jgi:predicted ATPase